MTKFGWMVAAAMTLCVPAGANAAEICGSRGCAYDGAGNGRVHHRLHRPHHHVHHHHHHMHGVAVQVVEPVYVNVAPRYYVDQGPTFVGPTTLGPVGTYEESAVVGWYPYVRGYSYGFDGGPYANAMHHYYDGAPLVRGPVMYRRNGKGLSYAGPDGVIRADAEIRTTGPDTFEMRVRRKH